MNSNYTFVKFVNKATKASTTEVFDNLHDGYQCAIQRSIEHGYAILEYGYISTAFENGVEVIW